MFYVGSSVFWEVQDVRGLVFAEWNLKVQISSWKFRLINHSSGKKEVCWYKLYEMKNERNYYRSKFSFRKFLIVLHKIWRRTYWIRDWIWSFFKSVPLHFFIPILKYFHFWCFRADFFCAFSVFTEWPFWYFYNLFVPIQCQTLDHTLRLLIWYICYSAKLKVKLNIPFDVVV